MLKKILGAGLAVVSTVVAACEGAPTTQQVYRRHEDMVSILQDASMKGPVLVQVHGNPFVTGEQHLDTVITEELKRAVPRIRDLEFTTDPAVAGNPKYRVVLAMGALESQPGDALCEANAEITTETVDPIRVVAVFCVDDTLYSEVRGSIKASASPDDKGFRKWVGQIGRDLLLSAAALPFIAPFAMN